MSEFNWRTVAPEPEVHFCDCGYCVMQGETEEKIWPTLVEAEVNRVDHITDKRLMLRAKVAPIPEDYEGSVISGPHGVDWPEVDETWTPAFGLHFLILHLAEIERLGWSIKRPVETDKPWPIRCGVADGIGKHVGWIMACKPNEDSFVSSETRPYAEVAKP